MSQRGRHEPGSPRVRQRQPRSCSRPAGPGGHTPRCPPGGAQGPRPAPPVAFLALPLTCQHSELCPDCGVSRTAPRSGRARPARPRGRLRAAGHPPLIPLGPQKPGVGDQGAEASPVREGQHPEDPGHWLSSGLVSAASRGPLLSPGTQDLNSHGAEGTWGPAPPCCPLHSRGRLRGRSRCTRKDPLRPCPATPGPASLGFSAPTPRGRLLSRSTEQWCLGRGRRSGPGRPRGCPDGHAQFQATEHGHLQAWGRKVRFCPRHTHGHCGWAPGTAAISDLEFPHQGTCQAGRGPVTL